MNKATLQGQWNQVKGHVKEKWGKLTDDDVDKVDGSYDRLVGAIQEKYGKEKEAVEKEIEAWQVQP